MTDKDGTELLKMNTDLNNFMAKMLGDIQRGHDEALRERVKADPQANKLVRLFEKGSNYRYFSGKDGRGRKVLFCWSTNRNIAGYFLGWREVQSAKGAREWKRDQWLARKVRTRCKEIARRRSLRQDAKMAVLKAKKETQP